MDQFHCQSSPVDVMELTTASVRTFGQQQPKAAPGASVKRSSAKKNKKKSNEDSDKPKRPLSVYNFFFQHERAQILKKTPSKYEGEKPRRSHGKIGFATLARSVATKWNNNDPETRKHFDQLTAEDKTRYKREMEAWKEAQLFKEKEMNKSNTAFDHLRSYPAQAFSMSAVRVPVVNAQSIVKCNLMAASKASQQSGRMVFSRFQGGCASSHLQAPSHSHCSQGTGMSHFVSSPSFYQNTSFDVHSNHVVGARRIHKSTNHNGNPSVVVGRALALLQEQEDNIPANCMPSFQPLDATTLSRVESEESHGSYLPSDVSELAAKLDDDCLGLLSDFLSQ